MKGKALSLYRAVVLISILLTSNAIAETNSTNNFFENYVDTKQKSISQGVNSSFNSIDKWISGLFNNDSCDDQAKLLDKALFNDNEDAIDIFFQNEKFLEETEKTFLRVRLSSKLQSKESTSYNYKIRAHIPLSRTKKNFNLYIDNIQEDYFDDTTTEDSDKTPDIGINYFSEEYHGIKSKYSIGTSGLNAYARARYYKVYKSGKWRIEPTQQFKYRIKDDWQEETNIYFDKKLEESSLFRVRLHRKTEAHRDGMDYALSTTYYHTAKRNSGLSFSQSFWGNTKYRVTPESKKYSNISNFTTSATFRQSVWRKWFAYEIEPAVSFHRQYDFEPNYILQLNLDFYFGNI